MTEEKKPKKSNLEECQKQRDEYLAGWQRARADFINYKKEEKERMEEVIKYGTEEILLNILPILDNFEAAEKALVKDSKDNENIKGILQIKSQLIDFLKQQGVKLIETEGKDFDPNFHEAVETIEEGESGKIIEEVQKGYTIFDRLLRPAKVKVTK